MILAHNKDARSEDYNELKDVFRPGHADFTYIAKYGRRDWRGSGRASARETLARVAAGAVAKKFLQLNSSIEILSYVDQIGNIGSSVNQSTLSTFDIEKNISRCPDQAAAEKMIALIKEVQAKGDSIGGSIVGVIRNCPAGLGEPVFDKLPAALAHAMMGINAVKGFEIGEGFGSVSMRG